MFVLSMSGWTPRFDLAVNTTQRKRPIITTPIVPSLCFTVGVIHLVMMLRPGQELDEARRLFLLLLLLLFPHTIPYHCFHLSDIDLKFSEFSKFPSAMPTVYDPLRPDTYYCHCIHPLFS